MTPADIAAITRVVGPVMREYCAKELADKLAPFLARNAALEQRILELETRPEPQPLAGLQGEKGETGTGIASLVLSADGRMLAHLTDGRSVDAGPVPRGPSGERGEQGPAGVRGEFGPAGERGEKGDAGPPGASGEQGPAGADGKDGLSALDGKDGADGLNGKDGQPGLNGKDGTPGERGQQGEKGIDGLHGRDGRDGAAGAQGERGMDGIDGRDGANGLNGKDGLDGLGFDDYDLVLDETRGWLLRLAQGERVKEWELPLPFLVGNWEAGRTYPKAAGVRWDGHYWQAVTKTSEQPGDGSTHWQIVVSRGRQGREGRPGKEGAPGKDLTQFDPGTGKKW